MAIIPTEARSTMAVLESFQPAGPRWAGPWPSISVVVPSLNQGRFLGEAIQSIREQDYPGLELIVVDGGSQDETPDVVRVHRDAIDIWICEPDRGQSDALRKGFERARGELLIWLNADDTWRPRALRRLASAFMDTPSAALAYGRAAICDEKGIPKRSIAGGPFDLRRSLRGWNCVAQPAALFSRHHYERVGGISEHLEYVMDAELWMRLSLAGEVVDVGEVLADFRVWPGSKTSRGALAFFEEYRGAVARLFDDGSLASRLPRERRLSFAHLSMQIAAAAYSEGLGHRARWALLEAITAHPGVFSERKWRRLAPRILLGHFVVGRLRALRRGVRGESAA